MPPAIPILEIGGTHVSSALVDPDGWRVETVQRLHVDGDSDTTSLLDRFVQAGRLLGAPRGVTWGVAMPDPFDYERGVGQFEGVGKFTSLRGVDVGAALREGLGGGDTQVAFLNDADAFTVGEWAVGAAAGRSRVAGLTLGTGVGSGWLVDGEIVDPVVPPGGRMHRMHVDGRPLEDLVSRRGIRRAFAAAGGDPELDVREIAGLARRGVPPAGRVLDAAMLALGRVVGRALTGFRADVLVVGGSMAASWDLFWPAFRSGALGDALPPVVVSQDSARAPMVGAALHAARHR